MWQLDRETRRSCSSSFSLPHFAEVIAARGHVESSRRAYVPLKSALYLPAASRSLRCAAIPPRHRTVVRSLPPISRCCALDDSYPMRSCSGSLAAQSGRDRAPLRWSRISITSPSRSTTASDVTTGTVLRTLQHCPRLGSRYLSDISTHPKPSQPRREDSRTEWLLSTPWVSASLGRRCSDMLRAGWRIGTDGPAAL